MRPTVRVAGIAIGFVLLAMPALVGPLARPVLAHALPQSSDPSPNSSLSVAPADVTITFGETPDPTLSSIKVLDKAGVSVVSGPTTAAPGEPKQLTVRLGTLPPGVYTVAWRPATAISPPGPSPSRSVGRPCSPCRREW